MRPFAPVRARDHALKGLLFVELVALHSFHEIRHQIGTTGELHIDPGPRVFDLVALFYELVERDDAEEAKQHDTYKQDDHDHGRRR